MLKWEVIEIAYVDFPTNLKGQKERKAFWLSDAGIQLIAGWRRNGTPVMKIAEEYVGISKTSWTNWCKESEALRKAVAASKDVTNLTVEEALYRRAVGYDYWEEVWELIDGELTLTKKFKKHLPPDTKAILHWLFNRLPSIWRSVQEPAEKTQYVDTIQNILIAMKDVASSGQTKTIEVQETIEEKRE